MNKLFYCRTPPACKILLKSATLCHCNTYRCINFNSHLLVTYFILYIFLSSSILFSLFQLESFFALPPKERKFVPRPSAQMQAILDVCSIPLQREITLKKITEIVHVFLYY
jgi:hypothetical protein